MGVNLQQTIAIVCFAAAGALFSLSVSLFWNVRRAAVSTSQLIQQTVWEHHSKVPITHKLIVCGLVIPTIFILGSISLTVNGLKTFYPGNEYLLVVHTVVLIVLTLVTVSGGLLQWRLFNSVITAVELLGEDHEECLNHGGNSLYEVMEMVQESVMVLNEELIVMHCNHASHSLFSVPLLVGVPLLNFIHPEDVRKFNEVATRTLASFSRETFTAEFRVRSNPTMSRLPQRTNYSNKCRPPRSKGAPPYPFSYPASHESTTSPSSRSNNSVTQARFGAPSSSRAANHRVYCEEPASVSVHTQVADFDEEVIIAHETRRETVGAEYVWMECTMCKGTSLNASQEYDYSIKMVARDINERKRRELHQYNDFLKESEEVGRVNAAKLRYLSCITHDLKTPLQSFSYTLDLLNHTPLLVEQSEFIEQANVAVDLMRLTISQTMDISKALTGAKLQPRRATVSLSAVLKRVKIIIDGYGKQVPLIFQVAPDICDEIITDEEWLWQMLLNLLTNACKYTDKGSIRLEVSVPNNPLRHHSMESSVSVSVDVSSKKNELGRVGGAAGVQDLKVNIPANPKAAMLLIEVHDTGVGVSKDKIGTLFDAFAQLQDGQVTGTGLGLFGVRTRAEGLLGTCGARHNTDSITGTGTILWFSIPYTPDPSARYGDSTAVSPQVRLAPSPVSGSGSGSGNSEPPEGLMVDTHVTDGTLHSAVVQAPRHSLRSENAAQIIRARQLSAIVVEDTMSVRKLMEKLLRMMGFASVVCYENGAKGLEAMMSGTVDIVFTDVMMPIMTGPEMVKRFRAFEANALEHGTRHTRQLIVAVTANGADLGVSSHEGFDEICAKPLSRRDINRIVLERFDTPTE